MARTISTVACPECVWDGHVDGWTYVGLVKRPTQCCTCGADVDCITDSIDALGSLYERDVDVVRPADAGI